MNKKSFKIAGLLTGLFLMLPTHADAAVVTQNIPVASTMAGVSNVLANIDYSAPDVHIENVSVEPVQEPLTHELNGYEVSRTRYNLVKAAEDMVGHFTYELGAKPDYENNWQVGDSLDCSGFTEYVYYLVTGYDIGQGTWNQSTDNIENGNAVYIDHDELLPGDLAFLMDGKDTVYTDENGQKCVRMNHVGIYMGKDENGEDLWCHSNAKDGTVSINSVSYWTRYMRITAVDLD